MTELENAGGRAYLAVPGYEWVDALPPMSEREACQAIDDGGVYFLEPDACPIGLLVLRWPKVDGATDCHLRELDVLPSHAGRGWGTFLLAETIRLAEQRGCRRVTLTTFVEVPFNGPWYQRRGFRFLEDAALTGPLREIRAQEVRAGLDRMPRKAMALELRARHGAY